MRASCYPFACLTLVACGGQVLSQAGGPFEREGGDEMTTEGADPGPELPIDANGAPTALSLDCGGSASSPIAFKLPCAVGMYPVNVTECYALDDAPAHSTPPILTFTVPLPYLAAHRNEPIDLDSFPRVPYSTPLVAGDVQYVPTHLGVLTVSQVDTVGRAYVGQLQGVEFTGRADGGAPIVCSSIGAPFWAVPGDFF